MNTAQRLFVEADVLQLRLRTALINSYRDTGDSARTRKIDAVLERAEQRAARRRRVVVLSTVTLDPFLEFVKKGHI